MAFPNPQNLGLEVSHLCIIDSKRYFCGHFAPAKVARSRHLREWRGLRPRHSRKWDALGDSPSQLSHNCFLG
jgi:hypothetical protein